MRRIAAAPETVFSFFSDPKRWLTWQGIDAEIEPRQGGVFRMNVTGDGYARGEFLVVDPPRRIVFTWGWEIEGSPVPPGTSTVDVTFEPDGDGTLVRLTHSQLPADAFEAHKQGWNHYLDRLVVRAEGGDPGPDPNAAGHTPVNGPAPRR